MQIQVFDDNTGEIIAWIDTNDYENMLTKKGYHILVADKLDFAMVNDKMKIKPTFIIGG